MFFTFQYNPEKLVHTFNQGLPSALGVNTADSQAPLFEFFNLTFELDSVDVDLIAQSQSSSNFGLHPALAMLELMMQPQMVTNQTSLPIVVFKWGAKRSMPVRIINMSIEEKSFDITLNPTKTTVSLTLRVLDAAEINNNPGARKALSDHQKMQVSLVDEYKQQTGQVNLTVAGANSNLAAAAGSGASVENKTKIKA
jgi:hypothetical protein